MTTLHIHPFALGCRIRCRQAAIMIQATHTLDANDPLALAHSDMLEWCDRAQDEPVTYLEGWFLYQELLTQMDVERIIQDALHNAGASGKAAA